MPFATASPTAAASPTTTKASRKRKRAIGIEAEEAEKTYYMCHDDENGFELKRIVNYWFQYEGEKKLSYLIVLFMGYSQR